MILSSAEAGALESWTVSTSEEGVNDQEEAAFRGQLTLHVRVREG